MEILTYKKVYQLVGDSASGTNKQILLADGTVATPISSDTLNLILT